MYHLVILAVAVCFAINNAYASVKQLVYPAFANVATQCLVAPQFHVNSLTGYLKALHLSNTYRFDPNMTFLPVCLNLPLQISDYRCVYPRQNSELHIGSLVTNFKKRRTQCYNLSLNTGTQNIIITEQTKAYVTGAQMFLAQDVTYNTLVHELAHFTFFAEEYVMRDTLKATQCQYPQNESSAPNLWAKIKNDDLVESSSKHPFANVFITWLEQVNDIQAHVRHDCSSDNIDWFTLMPNTFTFLRYNDVSYIPSVYKYMWQAQIRAGRFATYD